MPKRGLNPTIKNKTFQSVARGFDCLVICMQDAQNKGKHITISHPLSASKRGKLSLPP